MYQLQCETLDATGQCPAPVWVQVPEPISYPELMPVVVAVIGLLALAKVWRVIRGSVR